MKRAIGFAGAALVAGLLGFAVYWFSGVESPRRPDFRLKDLSGTARSISEWDGKVVLVNFWAPWCKPCREEMPMLVQLQQDYGTQGLQVLGLAIDEPAPVQSFAREVPVNYPLFADLLPTLAVQEAFGDTRLPFSVLIDRQGRMVFRKAGALTRAELDAELRKYL